MKTPLLYNLLAGLTLATVVTPSLHSAVLLQYTFAGGSAAPTTEAAEVSGSNAAWTGVSGGSFSPSSSTAFAPGSGVPASFSSSAYFSFTITADPGFFLDLDSLDFTLGGTNTSSTLTYTVNTNVRSNVDTFGSNLTINPGAVTTASHTVPTVVGSTTTYANFSVDLSGTDFDNLTTITLRLYPTDDSNASNNFLRYDNVTLNGSVTAVPEPTAAILLTISLMGLLAFRRLPFQSRLAK